MAGRRNAVRSGEIPGLRPRDLIAHIRACPADELIVRAIEARAPREVWDAIQCLLGPASAPPRSSLPAVRLRKPTARSSDGVR